MGLTRSATAAIILHPDVIDIPSISELHTKAKLTFLSVILVSQDPMITELGSLLSDDSYLRSQGIPSTACCTVPTESQELRILDWQETDDQPVQEGVQRALVLKLKQRSFHYDTVSGENIMPLDSRLPNARRVAVTILSICSYPDIRNFHAKWALIAVSILCMCSHPCGLSAKLNVPLFLDLRILGLSASNKDIHRLFTVCQWFLMIHFFSG